MSNPTHQKGALTIAADDYGLHPNIDKAIHTLAEKGILHKVSVMANANYTPKPLPDHIKTGLHVDLTTQHCLSGRPLAPSPFHLLRARHLSLTEIEMRIENQLAHLTSQGFKITHIDTHQHVHLIPTILQAVINIANKHHIPTIRCLTLQTRHYPFYMRTLLQCGFFKQSIKLHALYAGGLKMKSKRLPPPPNLILMPLAQGGNYTKFLNAIIHRFQNQTAELVTHPGLPSDIANEPYVTGREIEYQSLLSLANLNT